MVKVCCKRGSAVGQSPTRVSFFQKLTYKPLQRFGGAPHPNLKFSLTIKAKSCKIKYCEYTGQLRAPLEREESPGFTQQGNG